MKSKLRLSLLVPTLLSIGIFASAALSQAKSNKEFTRELHVIRSLAKDWGFVDLAQEQIEALRKSPNLTNDLSRKLSQVHAEVLFLGARRIRDLEERQKVLRESIQKFKDFLVEYGNSDEAPHVRATLAEACETYGSFLANRIEIEKDPDKRKAIKEEALDVFREGIKSANAAMLDLESQIEDDSKAKIQYFLSWLRKSTLLLRWAATIESDRGIKLSEAREELEDMVLTIGPETPLGMLGMLELGRSYDIEGHSEDAIMTFEDTVNTVMMVLENEENPVTPSRGALLFEFAERAYVRIGEIYEKEGRTKDSLALYERYSKRLAQFEASPSFKFGDNIVLFGAQALFAVGGKENRNKSLDLAKQIAKRHPADFTGIKAKQLIQSIVESGADVGASALLDAADGLYRSRKYGEAIQAFKRVLRSLKSPEEQQKHALRTWGLIANCYYKMNRYLEAYYAAREGYTRYGKFDQEQASKLAGLMMDSAARKQSQTKSKDFQKLQDEAKLAIKSTGGRDANMINWKEAGLALGNKKYDQAIQLYRGIAKDYLNYELAMVRIGVALYRKGDIKGARKQFDIYENYVKDKFHSIPASEINKQSVRKRGIAEMECHRGMIIGDEALGRNGLNPEPGKLKDLVHAFKGFREANRAYPDLATQGSFNLIKAYIELEKLDDAELEYAALKKQYPTDPTVALLAISLFKARSNVVQAVEAEVAGIKISPANRSKIREANTRLRAETRKALDFANTYVKLEHKPDYNLLRNAAKLALKIKDFEIARGFLRKIISVYSGNKKLAKMINKFVKPDLARIDLLDSKFDLALKSVEDALGSVKSKRSKLYFELIRMKAFALAGYRTSLNDSGIPVQQTGLGRFKEAYNLMWKEYGRYIKSKQVKQYGFEWYQFYFDCMDISLKVAANEDSAFMAIAKKFYRLAKSTDNFATLEKLGTEGEILTNLFRSISPISK